MHALDYHRAPDGACEILPRILRSIAGRSFVWQITFFYTVWGKIQPLERMLTLLDVGYFLKIPKIVSKSSACPVGTFSMRPNPPKCHIRQKIDKITNCDNKMKNPLELRLAKH